MNKDFSITVLNDNRPGRKLLAEHGLSYLIEYQQTKVLLDAGSSDVFLENAKRLGKSLEDIDYVVLSHGHWDHGDGLQYLHGKKLITHPSAFIKRYHKERGQTYVGLSLTEAQVRDKFDVQLSKAPVKLSESIRYLGEIPRHNDFESQQTAFMTEDGRDDFIPDDSGLVIELPEGLVVISGCAHAGICNTIDYAIEVTQNTDVLAVLGGFHLKKANEMTERTIAYLKDKSVKYVIPAHCTDLPALSLFAQNFDFKQLCTGDVITF